MKYLIRVALTVISLATVTPVANAASHGPGAQGYGISDAMNANG